MRLVTLIIFILFSCSSFGQDSLQIDTTSKTSTSTTKDYVIADSASATEKNSATTKKKQRMKLQKFKTKEEPVSSYIEDNKEVETNRNYSELIIIGVIIIAIIILLTYSRQPINSTNEDGDVSSKDDEFMSDYLSRMLLPRREYYRNVYLKSEAWKRKRYLVLKRDNWRCVYCGGRATQVHHTRYAKYNIGKEPIEWLVSICKTCHDSKHRQ